MINQITIDPTTKWSCTNTQSSIPCTIFILNTCQDKIVATTCPKRGHIRQPTLGIEWIEDGEVNTTHYYVGRFVSIRC